MTRNDRKSLSTRIRPMVFVVLLAVTQLLFHASPAWAQKTKIKEEETKSWVFPYALVISCLGLGMLAICRPGQRQDELPLKK